MYKKYWALAAILFNENLNGCSREQFAYKNPPGTGFIYKRLTSNKETQSCKGAYYDKAWS